MHHCIGDGVSLMSAAQGVLEPVGEERTSASGGACSGTHTGASKPFFNPRVKLLSNFGVRKASRRARLGVQHFLFIREPPIYVFFYRRSVSFGIVIRAMIFPGKHIPFLFLFFFPPGFPSRRLISCSLAAKEGGRSELARAVETLPGPVHWRKVSRRYCTVHRA